MREGQVLYQGRLDVGISYNLPVSLVKETEAFLGFLVLTWLRTDALVPMVSHNVAHKLEVERISFRQVRITFLEFFLDFSGAHAVEAEVLQDVLEELVWDGVLSLFQVVIEALLEVGGHVGRKVAGRAIGRLRHNLLLLHGLGCLLCCHVYRCKTKCRLREC